MNRNATDTKRCFGAFFCLLTLTGCGAAGYEVLEPTEEVEVIAEEIVVIYDQAEVTMTVTPLYYTQYPDLDTPCSTSDGCEPSIKETPELDALITKMKHEATHRTEAAAAAVLEVGPELMDEDNWEQLVTGAMELLSSPTLVVVQLQDNTFKKVKLEDISNLDIDLPQMFSIKAQVGAKMKAALKAHMVSYGVDGSTAKKLSSKLMDTYLSEL